MISEKWLSIDEYSHLPTSLVGKWHFTLKQIRVQIKLPICRPVRSANQHFESKTLSQITNNPFTDLWGR
jgi:hypothetical protein